jgi:toxin HigB-1
MIDNSININDLRVPTANRLEKLSGDRAGLYSIRINDQWRICFEWRGSQLVMISSFVFMATPEQTLFIMILLHAL